MSQIQIDHSENPPIAIIKALQVLLRPLVRFMLRNKITYTYLINLLKTIFVEIAQEKEFAIRYKPTTDSRITLLTGVHRKDVRNLRNKPIENNAPPKSITLGGQVIRHWYSAKEYQDDQGNPKPLLRRRQKDHSPSFESLVTGVNKDIRASVILEEWIKLGIATLKKGTVYLNAAAFIPKNGLKEKAYFMGQNLHDHISVCADNLKNNNTSKLERSVNYTHLTKQDIKELNQLGEKMGMEFLKKLNERALKLRHCSKGSPNATERMNFGLYFFYTQNTD